MAGPPPYPDTGNDADVRSDRGTPPGTPSWVKVFAIIAVVLILLVVMVMLTGGGPGGHTPPAGGH